MRFKFTLNLDSRLFWAGWWSDFGYVQHFLMICPAHAHPLNMMDW